MSDLVGGEDIGLGLDVVGVLPEVIAADVVELVGVGAVAATDDKGGVYALAEGAVKGILIDLSGVAEGVSFAFGPKVLIDVFGAIFFREDFTEIVDDAQSLVTQESRLVDYSDALKVALGIKAAGIEAGKGGFEAFALGRAFEPDNVCEDFGVGMVTDHQGRPVTGAVGKSGLSLLVFGFSVDEDGIAFGGVAPSGLPDFFYEHTGGVMAADGYAGANQPGLVLVGRAEGGDNNNVVRGQLVPKRIGVVVSGRHSSVDTKRETLVCLEVAESTG